MPLSHNSNDRVMEEMNKWDVIIGKDNYEVFLQKVWKSDGYSGNKQILGLTFSSQESEECFEFNDYGSPDNVFEFNDCRFLFRRNRDRGLYDLYVDGKLIY